MTIAVVRILGVAVAKRELLTLSGMGTTIKRRKTQIKRCKAAVQGRMRAEAAFYQIVT